MQNFQASAKLPANQKLACKPIKRAHKCFNVLWDSLTQISVPFKQVKSIKNSFRLQKVGMAYLDASSLKQTEMKSTLYHIQNGELMFPVVCSALATLSNLALVSQCTAYV